MSRQATDWLDEILGPLEREVLPRYLPGQRWFAGKARRLAAVRLVDRTEPGVLPAGAVLCLFEIDFEEGDPESYLVPLAQGADGVADCWILDPGLRLIDALALEDVTLALLGQIGTAAGWSTRASGAVVGVPTSAFAAARGHESAPIRPDYRRIEQSNSAVRYGDRLFLKVFRKLGPGINPDFEIGRMLGERTTFAQTPAMAGALEYRREGREPATLAILQEWAASAGTGWECALRALDGYFDRVEQAGDDGPPRIGGEGLWEAACSGRPYPAGVESLLGGELAAAATLGRRTGELHRALASDPLDSAFAPAPLATDDLATMAAEAREQCDRSLGTLRAGLGRLDGDTGAEARQILGQQDRLQQKIGGLAGREPGGFKIRIHGDYHLGQVLRTRGDDFLILDFEGEPAKPLDRRRAKQSPLKDVVGMLRSFDYAAFGALLPRTDGDPAARRRLTPWAVAWRDWSGVAFLRAYRTATAGAGLLPADPGLTGAMLAVLTLDKALYELLYELNNRPDWVRIPLRGVAALIPDAGTPTIDAEPGSRP